MSTLAGKGSRTREGAPAGRTGTATAHAAAGGEAFAGTRALARLALRRDRVMLPVWLAVFVTMAASSASATAGLFPTTDSVVQASQTFNGAQSLVALYGRIYDPTSVGALAMVKLGGLGAIFVAVLAVFMVVRHTRAEEEAGRLELVGATVVGRRAPLTAALLVVLGMNVVLAVLTALSLIAVGLPADGSFAFGLAWAAVGVAFAAIAAVTAQLTSGARAATGLAIAVLGLVYVLRAVGDTADRTGPRWLTWLSPIGWGQQFRPYAGNRWWVLLITLAFAAVVTAGAYVLAGRRDLGAGLLPDRPGPAVAAPMLRSPLALAWRLQRGTLLAWLAAFALLGTVFGNIATTAGGFLNSAQAREVVTRLGGAKALTDAYFAVMLGIVGVVASAYGVQAAMRLRSEETSLHAEALLSTATSRARWLWSHTVVALAGTTLLMVVAGGCAGLAYAAHLGEPAQAGRVLAAALVHVPAAWVLTGIVVAAFGLAPRWASAGWAALVAFVLLGEVGPVLKLDQRVMDLSPFAHVPRLPGSPLHPLPVVVLVAVTALLTAGGLAGIRRRDMPVG
jgi:polyether ionophore transport system permease protein